MQERGLDVLPGYEGHGRKVPSLLCLARDQRHHVLHDFLFDLREFPDDALRFARSTKQQFDDRKYNVKVALDDQGAGYCGERERHYIAEGRDAGDVLLDRKLIERFELY